MLVFVLTALASVVLFSAATWLIVRAAAKPPQPIRTQSRRSQAEYEFRRNCAALRRQGLLCLMAGVMSLGLCLTVGVWSVVTAGN